MRLVFMFAGLGALAAALPAANEQIEFEPTAVNTGLQDTPASAGGAATTCEECRSRYNNCVGLSWVPGLPACETVCMRRVQQQDEACKACDNRKTFPHFFLKLPPIEHDRT